MKIWQWLGYLGLLPFIATLVFSIQAAPLNIDKNMPFIAYSAIILSFMAGTLWRAETELNKQKLIVSNTVSLLAFSALLLPEYMALAVLSANYWLLYFYEVKKSCATKLSETHKKYLNMRFRLTITVLLFHILASVLWINT
ncbi:DUF3429 domain-containing protein [Paraglaciecola aquimarina]|uniref:DUF3429 domain-containing protein n=1 Tax=Paraglaciecola algarum TaxID=3050085 RepID=A0ABS9D893_9ALTE|nr:DUF3429 domain-containing protein [Paraglaciecola sp. G1-23]MCF2948217.1 DUF3429 domain-containing protein [Paraglaciecola sp. G1-23]